MSLIYSNYPELYDYLYSGDDQQVLEFVRWLLKYLDIKQTDKILDIGSGTGNIIIPIAQKGYTISGIEPYDGMRDIAISKATKGDVDIEIEKGRIQDVSDLQEQYDLVWLLNGPLHYLHADDDFLQIFEDLFETTSPGGYLLLDVMNFYNLIKNYRYPEIQEFEINNRRFVVEVYHHIDLDTEMYTNKAVVFIEQEENTWLRIDDNQEMLMYNQRELRTYASLAGFEFVHFFSSYQDRPDERVYGSRLILLFQRPS